MPTPADNLTVNDVLYLLSREHTAAPVMVRVVDRRDPTRSQLMPVVAFLRSTQIADAGTSVIELVAQLPAEPAPF